MPLWCGRCVRFWFSLQCRKPLMVGHCPAPACRTNQALFYVVTCLEWRKSCGPLCIHKPNLNCKSAPVCEARNLDDVPLNSLRWNSGWLQAYQEMVHTVQVTQVNLFCTAPNNCHSLLTGDIKLYSHSKILHAENTLVNTAGFWRLLSGITLLAWHCGLAFLKPVLAPGDHTIAKK